MRKLFLSMLMMLAFSSVAFAYSPENEADARKAIDAIKEIRYNVEAGVNLVNYNTVVSKAGVEYRRYADKYPDGSPDTYPSSSLKDMLNPYVRAGEIWHNAVYEDPRYYGINKAFTTEKMATLFSEYPVLKTRLKTYPDAAGTQVYWYEDIIRALWAMAAEQEKILNIKPKNPEQPQ
ncbi:MAG: hypothetical protein H6Q67_2101 [Firmicutes bacterium]|nr:hypothetical protein [Bacillota bacterium]